MRRPRGRVAAVAVAVSALMSGPLTGPAGATAPRPAPAEVVAGARNWFFGEALFYQQLDRTLVMKTSTDVTDLGGVLTSGPAFHADTSQAEEAPLYVFARGADNAVWYRYYIQDQGGGSWAPTWVRVGGRALGAPTASCYAPDGSSGRQTPIVWVRGGDGALWARTVGGPWSFPDGRWQRLGGRLLSDPVAANSCGLQTVYALGTDHAVWEFTTRGDFEDLDRPGVLPGVWRRVGGTSTVAPAASIDEPDGTIRLFARGTDDALWMTQRGSGSATWSGWRRLGGALSSPPSAAGRYVYALGASGRNVWRADRDANWTWQIIP